MFNILMVMTGGGLGALCRYGISVTAARYVGTRFPLGTLIVNLVGCFLIGVSFALADRTTIFPPSARLFFMTGFLGALTTFSTYALESVNYLLAGSYVAMVNFLLNNIGGGVLVIAGFWVGRLVERG